LICSSRRLLAQSPETCSAGDTFSLYSASNSSEIIIQGSTVCSAGDNEVIYDIGHIDNNGNFIPAVLNAHSQTITVELGPPSRFQLVAASSQPERTLSSIRSSIFVQLMDAGQNVSMCIFDENMSKPIILCAVC
jgi:hypothetical protein